MATTEAVAVFIDCHEPMGVIEEVGPDVTEVKAGERVVIPFNVSCQDCWMCNQGLNSQCETSQVRDQGMGGSLFGFTNLYGCRSDAGPRCSTSRSSCAWGRPTCGTGWRTSCRCSPTRTLWAWTTSTRTRSRWPTPGRSYETIQDMKDGAVKMVFQP